MHQGGKRGQGALAYHELCALYSSGTAFPIDLLPDDYAPGCIVGVQSAFNLDSVRREARRGRRLRCSLCDERGASIGCYACSRKCFHFPCAERAGLVEWQWWESGHRARVVHCTQHLDPRVCVQEDSNWYDAAAVHGPDEGRYLFLYVERPFGQESLALNNECAIVCRPAPTGAYRWATFAAACKANDRATETAPPPRPPARRTRALRCILGGSPLDAVCVSGHRRRQERWAAEAVARPLVNNDADREESAAATKRACLPLRLARADQPRSSSRWRSDLRRRDCRFSALAPFVFEWVSTRESCLARAVSFELYVAVRQLLPRLFRAGLERHIGAAAARDAIRCFASMPEPCLEAFRWLSGNSLRWAAADSSSAYARAGPGFTSVRVPRPLDASACWLKTGPRAGDVTLACACAIPINAAVCWEVKVENIARMGPQGFYEDVARMEYRPAIEKCTLGVSTGLAAPSPFWLGREPRSGIAGKGLGVDAGQPTCYFATDLAVHSLLDACGKEIDRNIRTLSGDRIGFLLDTRSQPRFAVYLNGRLLGSVRPEHAADFSALELSPAASLCDYGWRVTVAPAVPVLEPACRDAVPANIVSCFGLHRPT